jgi:hypothetical protein
MPLQIKNFGVQSASNAGDAMMRRQILVEETRKVGIEPSKPNRVFDKADEFLRLGGSSRNLDLSDLSPAEKEQFLKILSGLLKRGIVGYEELEVQGKTEKHFLVNTLGNQRLAGAKPALRKNT